MPTGKLTKRLVDSAKANNVRITWWDTEISGFGLRVTPAGVRTYVLKYRAAGRQGWITIGKHGSPWTPDMARNEAKRLLGDLARGLNPSKKKNAAKGDLTFGQLCDLYLEEGIAHKKASTIRSDRGRIALHLKPLLGGKPLGAIGRQDIERLLVDVVAGRTRESVSANGKRKIGSLARGGKGVAARCVELAGTIFSFAVARNLRADNPASGIKRPKSRKLDRFLSEKEIARLAASLDEEAKARGPYAVAAIKLLMLTGCRRSEILNLKWADVDFEGQCLRLPDSKTGAKTVYLNAPALAVLRGLPRLDSNPYVIVGSAQGSAYVGINKLWQRVRARAGLSDVRLHDLRHSFASVGVAGGLSLPIIGALLGHRQSTTTARYAHLSADPVRAANEAVGERIAAAMAQRSSDALPS
jgi:integrase